MGQRRQKKTHAERKTTQNGRNETKIEKEEGNGIENEKGDGIEEESRG